MKRTVYVPRNYTRAVRKRSLAYTPTPNKRMRMTSGSQLTGVLGTQRSLRFTPRSSQRKVAITNLRRRLQRTPRRMRMRRNVGAYGASMSKSVGFIQTRDNVNRMKRNKTNKYGVSIVLERGGVVDAGANTSALGNTVAVGHCNFPLVLVHQMLWRAIIKKLFVKTDYVTTVVDFEAQLGGAYNGAFCRLSYRQSSDDVLLSQQFNITTTTTPDDIALYFAKFFYDDLQLNGTETEFMEIRLSSSGGAADVILNLRSAKFHVYGKSTLKIQNRTVQDAADDEESVDNVPLHGKAYFGKGTGTSAFTRDGGGTAYVTAASGFHCDMQYGALAKVPVEKWYQEPPPASTFIRVQKTGKVLLDPGHIRTSVLDDKIVISLKDFYKRFHLNINVATPVPLSDYHNRSDYGHYRFVILEKMINAVVGSATNSIKVAYEQNIRMGGYLTCYNETETAQLNSVANIANEA